MRNEYPIFNNQALCPLARFVGGTSVYLCECKEPRDCEGARAGMLLFAAHIQSYHPVPARELGPVANNVYLSTINDGDLYRRWSVPFIKRLGELYTIGRYVASESQNCWFQVAAEEAALLARRGLCERRPTHQEKRAVAARLANYYAQSVAEVAYFGSI